MSRDLRTHLTIEEFVQFVTDDLPEESAHTIDRHIAQCERCAAELEQFYDAEEKFPQERWAAQRNVLVAELRDTIFGNETNAESGLRERLQQWTERFRQMKKVSQAAFARNQLVRAASQSERQTLHNGKSADGVFRWIIIREKNGDLCYMFESQQPVSFKFRAGPFEEEVTLKQKTRTAFFAEVTVPGRSCPEGLGDFDLEVIP